MNPLIMERGKKKRKKKSGIISGSDTENETSELKRTIKALEQKIEAMQVLIIRLRGADHKPNEAEDKPTEYETPHHRAIFLKKIVIFPL